MEFDPRNFVSVKLVLDGDVINVVAVNLAEHTAHVADNPVLAAVINDRCV